MKSIQKLIRNPLSLIGLIIIFFFLAIAVGAPWLCPPIQGHDPYSIPRDGFSMTPQPPDAEHPCGTAEGQYDIYYGVIWGARTAFRVGLIVTGSITLLGVIIGTIAGFYGGAIDEIIMRMVDVFMSFPFLVATMVLTVILGKGLDKVMTAMIVFGWPSYARLSRGSVLSAKENDYVEAAKAISAGSLRIMFRHILPNTIFPVLVMASMDIGAMVLAASTMSFLGIGAEVGYADWGQLISFARNWVIGSPGHPFEYWYTIIFPGVSIILFVLGWSLIGDAFRDILDPRMRGTR